MPFVLEHGGRVMRVRAARKAKGWSQEHLAAASGVGLRTVQRVESGSRVSPENTLALCATLGIEPTDLPVAASSGPGTLPHLARVRSELDKAMADFGERPVWQKSDATASVAGSLRRMGLAPDTEGFAEARRRVSEALRKVERASLALHPLALAWACGLLPVAVITLLREHPDRWAAALPWIAALVATGIPLAMAVVRARAARDAIMPAVPTKALEGSIVVSDLTPVEVALTPGSLWVAKAIDDEVRVIRLALNGVRDVTIHRVADGLHLARFEVEFLPWRPWSQDTAFEVTRLGDEEAAWLERRFAVSRNAVVWTPQPA